MTNLLMLSATDPTSVIQMITNVGFPIAMCLIMAYYIYSIEKRFSDQLDKVEERHEKDIEKLTEVVDNNTEVLNTISTKLDILEGLK